MRFVKHLEDAGRKCGVWFELRRKSKIAPDTIPEIFGFADIEQSFPFVIIVVNPWRIG
jgi:hypothetical protein